MRRVLCAAALTLAAVIPASDQLAACGDKFLLVGWGVKPRQMYAAIHPASILIYARPGTSAALGDPKFVATLTRAGHKVSVVQDEERLNQVLGAGKFDLALTDLRSAPALAGHVTTALVKPLTLPVLNKPSKAETDACRQQYTCELKLSDRPDQFLRAIDGVMKAKTRKKTT